MSLFDFFKKPEKEPYTVFTYRTKNGESYMKFSYHKIRNGYEIDIHQMPEFPSHLATDGHTIHVLPGSRDTDKKICVRTRNAPKTLEKAQKFSMEYAELLEVYRKTGITPDEQILQRN